MACGPGCGCDCCAGTAAAAPWRPGNPPGLPAIAYRAGRHATFLASMKSRLSSADHPALAGLTTREDSDATIALLDGLASSLDVLSFYTERYANEHYLRTATERLSLIEMARLIGYEPAPGVAAATHLAFSLQEIPGAPPAEPIVIPVGTRVQSVPGQDEKAQAFETVAHAPARAEWNAVPARTTLPWAPAVGQTGLWLVGAATGLEPGDAILIVGSERADDNLSPRWAVRALRRVIADAEAGRTRVEWADPLAGELPQSGVEVHALRQRASLFGHNAPDPNLLGNDDSNISTRIDKTDTDNWVWENFIVATFIDIEPANPKVVSGGWVALVSNTAGGMVDLPGHVELYKVQRANQMTRQDFAISSKITRVTPDSQANLTSIIYNLRQTLVLAQSERLEVAPVPLPHPVQGDRLVLGRRVEGLVPGQPVALSGRRQPLSIRAPGLTLAVDDGGEVALAEGDRLFMTGPAVWLIFGFAIALPAEIFVLALAFPAVQLRLPLMDRDGRTGTLETSAGSIALAPGEKADATVREIAFVGTGETAVVLGRDITTLALAEPLAHVYERVSLRLNANVAPATHGESVEAILGDGDGRRANQRFTLNQAPLTRVSAATPSGRASTLEVRINDVLWTEAPSLYQAAADARVYETVLTDDGYTSVQFGDGIEGARLPSGATNVRARYRKGIGAAGNVAAGKITTLLSRPLGVSEAVNPSPATGGEDPETLDRARHNAPLTVLTLDRAVSIADYQNLARAFAGIDKAHALWIPSGIGRGVFLTIAGVDGAEVAETGTTFANLAGALRDYGDALVPIRIVNHIPSRIRIRAAVKSLAAYLPDKVLAAVEAALRAHFAFAARSFGQTVSVDEVAAVAQGVAGVEAVHVLELYREGDLAFLNPRIFARMPTASVGAIPDPAELLTLSDAPVLLEAMA